jgi:hypothetical protein
MVLMLNTISSIHGIWTVVPAIYTYSCYNKSCRGKYGKIVEWIGTLWSTQHPADTQVSFINHRFNYRHQLTVLSIQKRSTNRFALTSYKITDGFWVHLKGYSCALSFKKPVTALRAKKGGVFFIVDWKNSEVHCDLEVQAM